MKLMIDSEIEQTMIWISEILEEAASFGLRGEVEDWAQKELRENPGMSLITAYQNGFLEWIK